MRGIFAIGFALIFCAAGVAGATGGRCDGCGMFLAPYARTVHRLTPAAGKPRSFCSFGCLAEALEKTTAAGSAKIEAADYASGRLVDARKAAYVERSDAPPVMGHVSLVAFATPGAAAEYRKTHGGSPTDLARALEQHRAGAGHVAAVPEARPAAPLPPFSPLPKPGRKIPIDRDHSFVFSFSKKPAMETIIVKVEIFGPDGGKDTSLEVRGDADMPSMKGAHTLGDQPFKRNRKGDYLLPITFVMPGDWEVYFTFVKDGVVIFRGKYAFDI